MKTATIKRTSHRSGPDTYAVSFTQAVDDNACAMRGCYMGTTLKEARASAAEWTRTRRDLGYEPLEIRFA